MPDNNFIHRVERILNDSDVQAGSPDWKGDTDTTWCNRAVNRILEESGYVTEQILDLNPNNNSPDIDYTSANEMAHNLMELANNPGYNYMEVNATQAQALANDGYMVIGAWENNNGHGHVAAVVPHYKYDVDDGPMIGQAGKDVGIMLSSEGFGTNNLGDTHWILIPKNDSDFRSPDDPAIQIINDYEQGIQIDANNDGIDDATFEPDLPESSVPQECGEETSIPDIDISSNDIDIDIPVDPLNADLIDNE